MKKMQKEELAKRLGRDLLTYRKERSRFLKLALLPAATGLEVAADLDALAETLGVTADQVFDVLLDLPIVPFLHMKDPGLFAFHSAFWAGRTVAAQGAAVATGAVVTHVAYSNMLLGGLWQYLGWFAPSLVGPQIGALIAVGVLAGPVKGELTDWFDTKRAVVIGRASYALLRDLLLQTEVPQQRRMGFLQSIIDNTPVNVAERHRMVSTILQDRQHLPDARAGSLEAVEATKLSLDGFLKGTERELVLQRVVQAICFEGRVSDEDHQWLDRTARVALGFEDDVPRWLTLVRDEALSDLRRQTIAVLRLVLLAFLAHDESRGPGQHRALRLSISDMLNDADHRAALRDFLLEFPADLDLASVISRAQELLPGIPLLRSGSHPLLSREVPSLLERVGLRVAVNERSAKEWKAKKSLEGLAGALSAEPDASAWHLDRMRVVAEFLAKKPLKYAEEIEKHTKKSHEIQEEARRARQAFDEDPNTEQDLGKYLVGYVCPHCHSRACFYRAVRNLVRRNTYQCQECGNSAVMKRRGSGLEVDYEVKDQPTSSPVPLHVSLSELGGIIERVPGVAELEGLEVSGLPDGGFEVSVALFVKGQTPLPEVQAAIAAALKEAGHDVRAVHLSAKGWVD